MRETKLVFLSVVLISIAVASANGCSSARTHAPRLTDKNLSSVTAPGNWHKVDATAFSLFAPSGWEFHQLRGVDSYVGEFVGDGVALKFDFGGYSSGCFDEAKEPAYLITQETIGGFPAKVATPRTPSHGFTGIYFRRVARSTGLCLWGQDLTSAQQEIALRVFETIRFEHFEYLNVIPPPPPPPKPQ